jgi:hypothetical protein
MSLNLSLGINSSHVTHVGTSPLARLVLKVHRLRVLEQGGTMT